MNPSPYDFDSDLDYYDACDPEAAAWRDFCEDEKRFLDFAKGFINEIDEECWDKFPEETFAIFEAIREADYRPLALKTWNFHADCNAWRDADDCERFSWFSADAIELLLFSDLSTANISYELLAKINEFKATILEAADDFEWLKEEWLEKQEEKAAEPMIEQYENERSCL